MLAKLMSLFLLGLVRMLTGAQARWYGCPPKAEQRIYFANHQSHADLVMIWAALPEELHQIERRRGDLLHLALGHDPLDVVDPGRNQHHLREFLGEVEQPP